MCDELKPCPFCGGEANLQDDYCSEPDETRWMVWHLCEDGPKGQFVYYDKPACLSIETPWFDSRDKAIEAWNERADRKCRNVHEPPENGFWPFPHFKCSECGHIHVSPDYVFYCPSCGAEVVD